MNESQFNPLDKKNLGESVAAALLGRPLEPLPPVQSFNGAGVYALYYAGGDKMYEVISGTDRPIYVGKAVPAGARKGQFGLGLPAGTALFERLNEHARSIAKVGFELADFRCRFLVTDDIWIPLGESLLIERFLPLWNVVVDGFGNHDPGGGRRKQQRSKWDTIHPGRSWAALLEPNQLSADDIVQLARDFLAGKRAAMITTSEAVADEE